MSNHSETKPEIQEQKKEKPAKKENLKQQKENKPKKVKPKKVEKKKEQEIFRDTIMTQSFVSMQEDDDYSDIDSEDYEDEINQTQDKEKVSSKEVLNISSIVKEVRKDINNLFDKTCFAIDTIEVSVYDNSTLLIEFKGDDAALLIGKEGYRYKALSYMIFNWLNTKYEVQLRLEIAEFLKNQEESVSRYLEGVRNSIEKDGRAQTKILDGVLVQIALKELRNSYPNKYVAIRTTRDGLKYIIVNDYHN